MVFQETVRMSVFRKKKKKMEVSTIHCPIDNEERWLRTTIFTLASNILKQSRFYSKNIVVRSQKPERKQCYKRTTKYRELVNLFFPTRKI